MYKRTPLNIGDENWAHAHRLFQCILLACRPSSIEELAESRFNEARSLMSRGPTGHGVVYFLNPTCCRARGRLASRAVLSLLCHGVLGIYPDYRRTSLVLLATNLPKSSSHGHALSFPSNSTIMQYHHFAYWNWIYNMVSGLPMVCESRSPPKRTPLFYIARHGFHRVAE
jgi:hypothetical protein